MKLLAIEASTDACSVAVSIDGETLIDHRVAAQQHGELLLSMVDALMAEAGLTPTQLDALVYGRGPGSFTGVRIGVAAAQGIALGADIGVVGISTLQSVAQGCLRESGDTSIAVCVDARMNEVYFCEYRSDQDGLMQAMTEEQLSAPTAVTWRAATTWAGTGAERYAQVLQSQFCAESYLLRAGCLPQAQDHLTLGAACIARGSIQPAELAAPVYLRNKVALTTAEREGNGVQEPSRT